MKNIYIKIRELINEKMAKLTMSSAELPRIIYIVKELKDSIIEKHSNIESLIADDSDADTVIFIVSPVPSPYVDSEGKMFLGESDFDNLMPFLLEFFSSKQRNIPINEAFNILIDRLTGE